MASFNPPIQYEIGDWIEFPTYHGMLAAFTYIHVFFAFLHFVSKQVRCCLFSIPHPTFSSVWMCLIQSHPLIVAFHKAFEAPS